MFTDGIPAQKASNVDIGFFFDAKPSKLLNIVWVSKKYLLRAIFANEYLLMEISFKMEIFHYPLCKACTRLCSKTLIVHRLYFDLLTYVSIIVLIVLFWPFADVSMSVLFWPFDRHSNTMSWYKTLVHSCFCFLYPSNCFWFKQVFCISISHTMVLPLCSLISAAYFPPVRVFTWDRRQNSHAREIIFVICLGPQLTLDW